MKYEIEGEKKEKEKERESKGERESERERERERERDWQNNAGRNEGIMWAACTWVSCTIKGFRGSPVFKSVDLWG